MLDTVAVRITDRPRPARDAAAIAGLRAALAREHPAVVHAHGVRAGVFAALAIATLPASGWRS